MPDDYLAYVEAIDAGAQEVSDWEARFIEDLLKHRPYSLSPKQWAIVRQMAEKYLGETFE